MSITTMLGVMAVIVSLWDKFGTPRYRPYRACVFIVFGLSLPLLPTTLYRMGGRSPSMKLRWAGWSSWGSSTSLAPCSMHSEFQRDSSLEKWIFWYYSLIRSACINIFYSFSVPQSPDISLFCYSWCLCSLPWHI